MRSVISALVILIAGTASALAADFTLPLRLAAGDATTTISLGIRAGAGNGYDAGLDTPSPFEGETLAAFFSHPEWQVTAGGGSVSAFAADIRGTFPQEFTVQVKGSLSPVEIRWDPTLVPPGCTVVLEDATAGQIVDMILASRYSFTRSGTNNSLVVRVTGGDSTPPTAPVRVEAQLSNSGLCLVWAANNEPDLAGYKVHYRTLGGSFTRSVDVKNVNNFNMMNMTNMSLAYLGVSAYDTSGNQSAVSEFMLSALLERGDVDGDGAVTLTDALRTLRCAVGRDPLTEGVRVRGDVAPPGAPDGVINVRDVLLILKRSLGLAVL